MKKLIVLLGLSLAANTVLLFNVFLRPSALRRAEIAPATVSSESHPSRQFNPEQLAALAAGNLSELRAAAVPEEIARNLVIGRAYTRLQARTRALRKPAGNVTEYWKNSASPFGTLNDSKETRLEMNRAQREYAETIRAASENGDFADSRYAYLPTKKREQLHRIEQDYTELRAEIYSDMGGIAFTSDQEKLRLVQQEQDRDIAATLSPEELNQYNLRSSSTAQGIRSRFGDAIKTEDEYRRIFSLQKAFDDQYSNPNNFGVKQPSPEQMALRTAADAKLQNALLAALSPESFTAIQRAMDSEYKALTSVTKRLNLPATTTDAVLASRDAYAIQSQQINQNSSLSEGDRLAQMKQLAAKARTDLISTLGTDGAEAYLQRINWINLLNRGTAFSTNANDIPTSASLYGASTWPVQPPKPASAPKK